MTRLSILLLLSCDPSPNDTAKTPALSKSDVYTRAAYKTVPRDLGSITKVQAACQENDDLLLTGSCFAADAPLGLLSAGARSMGPNAGGDAYWQCAWHNIGWEGPGDLVVTAEAHCIEGAQ